MEPIKIGGGGRGGGCREGGSGKGEGGVKATGRGGQNWGRTCPKGLFLTASQWNEFSPRQAWTALGLPPPSNAHPQSRAQRRGHCHPQALDTEARLVCWRAGLAFMMTCRCEPEGSDSRKSTLRQLISCKGWIAWGFVGHMSGTCRQLESERCLVRRLLSRRFPKIHAVCRQPIRGRAGKTNLERQS